jgi:hypothetical protein
VPAQAPPSVDGGQGRYLLVPVGSKLAMLDMAACSGNNGNPCAEIANFDTAAYPGGGDKIVSSPAVYGLSGNRIFFHSSTGTLWKVSWTWTSTPPTFGYDGTISGWACRYLHTNQSKCMHAGDSVEGADGVVRPVRDYGAAGGWYQPTTRAERDELHTEIRARHLARFGAARGAPASASERADHVAHVARLARELPRADLLAIVTPSGYHRKGSSGRPGPGVEDFAGVYPFATPAIYNDGQVRIPRSFPSLLPL